MAKKYLSSCFVDVDFDVSVDVDVGPAKMAKKYLRSYFVDVGVGVDGNDFFSLVLLMIPSFCRPWRSALKLDVIQPESC